MDKQLIRDGVGWGFVLWLIGYVLGIVFFMLVSQSMIGWIIMPIGIVITVWVLLKKIKGKTLTYYLKIAVIWTLIAIILDYLFLVTLFKSKDGYYKLDVYLYYFSTFILPLLFGLRKR